MRKVSRAALAGVFGAGVFGAGCTAILGSFEVLPAGDGAADATSEDPAPPSTDEGGVADASSDAAGGLLSCAVVNARDVETVSAPGFDRFLSVFRAGDTVRVVTRVHTAVGSTGVPTGIRTYAFEPSSRVTVGDFASQPGVALDVRRVGQQLTVLAYEPVPNGGLVVAWELPDGEPTKLARRPISTQLETVMPGVEGVTGALGTYALPSEYFYAVSVPTPGIIPTNGVFVGHVTANTVPKPALVTSGRAGPGVAVNTLARNAQGIFVFNADAPTPTQPTASTGYFRVSENPPHSPDTSFEPIVPAGGEKGMALFAAAGALPGLKVAVSEVDLSGVGPPVVVRAGVLGPADLAPFDAAKLPPAIEFASAAELPIEGGQGRLFDDELVIIGAPPDPQRGQGLNFVWYDLASRSIRARQTGAERLVPQRSGITAASITFARVPTGPTVDFDLVWIESSAGQSKLLYGELRCVRSQE